MDKIKLGTYRHYKGGMYEVIGIVNHSETLEKMVLYKKLKATKGYPAGSLWVRPLKMFLEKVAVDGKEIDRFQYIKNIK